MCIIWKPPTKLCSSLRADICGHILSRAMVRHIMTGSEYRSFCTFTLVYCYDKIQKYLVTIQSHADLYKTGCSSLLDKDCFYKSIWREAIHEQNLSLVEAVLRMGSE